MVDIFFQFSKIAIVKEMSTNEKLQVQLNLLNESIEDKWNTPLLQNFQCPWEFVGLSKNFTFLSRMKGNTADKIICKTNFRVFLERCV